MDEWARLRHDASISTIITNRFFVIHLARIDHKFGEIRVLKSKRNSAVVYLQDGVYQSRCDKFGVSLAAYVHALLDLIIQAQSRSVLIIGCGGGSLGTLVDSLGVDVTMIDVNPDAIAIARNYFGLSNLVKCVSMDGAEYLNSSKQRFDAIVMDAYCGGGIPAHLSDASFFKLVKNSIHENSGVFLANIYLDDYNDRTAVNYATTASQIWSTVRLLDSPHALFRNATVLAGDVNEMIRPCLRIQPDTEFETIASDLSRMTFRRRV